MPNQEISGSKSYGQNDMYKAYGG